MEFIGIDIAKRKFDLMWITLATGKKKSKVFDNSPTGFKELFAWLTKHELTQTNCHLAMEATSQYYEALAQALHDAGFKISVVNPYAVKHFGQANMSRQKTDKADAELIARYCQQIEPRPWTPPSPQVRELQRLVARLDAVQDMLVQEENRRHVSSGATLDSVERMIASLKEEEELLKRMIKDHIDDNPEMREQEELLRSIPGVGERLAAYVLAWLQTERFDDAREAVAFVGLSPQHHDSGDSIKRKAKICKLGHSRLRKMLYFPAVTAIRCNPAAQVLAGRLTDAGKRPKVRIVAVMRKLVHWMYGVLKSGSKFDVQLALAKA